MKQFEPLISEYQNIEIPDELEFTVRKTINSFEHDRKKNKNIIVKFAVSVAAVVVLFVGAVNLSPAAASAFSKIPVIKDLVRLVNIKELVYQSDMYKADIKVPQVKGLENSRLEESLNKKYLDENKALYDEFLKGIGKDKLSPQILALYTNYSVKTNTKDIFVVERIKTEIAASGTESVCYDNIDLKNQIIITLPSLFKDDSYIDVISDNIKTQMREQTNKAEGIMFFIEGDGSVGGFDKINSAQTFYINADSKLVIVFNEYEVAPGCMGIVEFVIPTKVIQDILVSNMYIK